MKLSLRPGPSHGKFQSCAERTKIGRAWPLYIAICFMLLCCICLYNYHMKCLTLEPKVYEYIQENNSTWYCQMCITEILPFNHNENEDVFMCDINCIETCSRTIEQLSELIFNPFELNMDDHYSPLYDVDPDMNYYNELDSHIGLNCNYYLTIPFHVSSMKSWKKQIWNVYFPYAILISEVLKPIFLHWKTALILWISNSL